MRETEIRVKAKKKTKKEEKDSIKAQATKTLFTLEQSTTKRKKIAAVPLQVLRNTNNFKNKQYHRRKTNP